MNYYDPEGNAVSVIRWGKLFEQRFSDPDDSWWRRKTTIDETTEVSTVWIGIDCHWGVEPPLFFETIIFGGSYDQRLARYSSKEQAWAGHASVVAALKTGKNPFPNHD